MEIISLLKEVFTVAQKADNIGLEKQILEIEQQAIDLVEENRDLKEKVAELQEALKIKDDIERHYEPYITLKSDPSKRPYCATCYANTGKLIQMIDFDEGTVDCPSCHIGFSKCPEKDNIEQ